MRYQAGRGDPAAADALLAAADYLVDWLRAQ
jgi:hypothetical protein